ncbi:tetratricopeptide repeat protein [Caulobacter sp. ErkDOM-YI]|uniref:tetratricopeptide repeat protein n=1 Tax=unclassified Caulobacter TaxID=2648921 RepID=UPI003AF9DFF5
MLARIVGIILGTILATSGYVVAGWGQLGSWAAYLDLGPFEPHRPLAGAAAAILGGVFVVAALTPRPKPKRRRTGPVVLDLESGLEAVPVIAPAQDFAPIATPVLDIAPAPVAVPQPAPVPRRAQAAPSQAKPAAPVGDTFAHLRERMIALTRAESWPEAARLLIAMKGAASGDRELATVYRDLGDFARSQGQMDDAAEAYDTAVSHARDALRTTPGDVNAMELLAGTLAGVGDVAETEGRLDDALSAFEESLALRRSSGGREAGDPGAQRALSVSLERLADLREDRGHRMRALDLYRESYDVAARLAAADPARFGSDLALTRQRLAELEAKVST